MMQCGWGPTSSEWAEARAAGKECDWQFAPPFPSRFDYRYDHATGKNEKL